MINTVWARVHEGRIEPLDKITAPEGTRVLVTMLLEEADSKHEDISASVQSALSNPIPDQETIDTEAWEILQDIVGKHSATWTELAKY